VCVACLVHSLFKIGCKLPDSVRTLPEGSAPLVTPKGTSEVG